MTFGEQTYESYSAISQRGQEFCWVCRWRCLSLPRPSRGLKVLPVDRAGPGQAEGRTVPEFEGWVAEEQGG